MPPNTAVPVDLVSVHITELLEDVLQTMDIADHTIEVSPGSIRGDNYLGVIAKVVVSRKRKTNGDVVQHHYVVKSAPKNEAFRKFTPIRLAYEREIYMYSVVLPEFHKMQEEKGVATPFSSICKCHATCLDDRDEALIMEDMKSRGYVMRSRHEPLDYEHTRLVFQQYAKLHAFSFALRDQKPELFKKLTENCEDSFMSNFKMDEMQRNSDASCDQAMKALDPIRDKEATERFSALKDRSIDVFQRVVRSAPAGDYAVIGHGDSWVNNMLFKYGNQEQPNIPTNLCILDWQLARYGSPALDLSYFIYTCTDKKLRDEHFEDLLQEYHDTMYQFIRDLGTDPEGVLPMEVLKEHFKQFAIFGLTMAMMVIRLMTSEVDEIPDIIDVVESQDYNAFQYESKNVDKFNERIRDVIYHCIDYGVL